jgi:uncharacterized protein (UPF0333 family)
MAMKMQIKKGFSLLELTLVLGVGTMVAFMKFQDMKNFETPELLYASLHIKLLRRKREAFIIN